VPWVEIADRKRGNQEEDNGGKESTGHRLAWPEVREEQAYADEAEHKCRQPKENCLDYVNYESLFADFIFRQLPA